MSLQIQKVTAYDAIVTTAVAKNYIKQDYGTDTVEDTLVASLVQQAHEFLERRLNRSLSASTTWIVWTDEEEDFVELDLPRSPHTSITEIVGLDIEEDETELTLNSTYWKKGNKEYVLRFSALDGGDGVPRGSVVGYEALKITFVAGYATAPEAIVDTILMIVADSYVNRGDGDVSLRLPAKALQIADSYKHEWI